MSLLTLVRHGQASFFADDYDKLSNLGEEQARRLGQHWAEQGRVVNQVFVGPRARQQRSAEVAGAVYRQSGLSWPEPIMLPEFDEYDLAGLTTYFAPQLAREQIEFAGLIEKHRQSQTDDDRLRSFQRMFEVMLRHWQLLEHSEAQFESWPKFRSRVQAVIRQIQSHSERNQRVVVFTSGGFIGTAVQLALRAADDTALELNWRVRNSSLTDFVFTPDRFTLDSFNMIPHLPDSRLWTYR